MICIYHNRDLDGYTSAAIVKLKYPFAILIGYDYGQPFPWGDIPKGMTVIMVDVSIPIIDMRALAIRSGQFTWIDHHISAINEFNLEKGKDVDLKSINAVLENGISACEGAWKYLFPDLRIPKAVQLLGEYDTWRNSDKQRWENEILPFQFGMRERCNSAETFPLWLLTQDDEEDIIEIIKQGKTILNYNAKVNEAQCKKNAFEIEFEGLRAICLNGGGFNSDVFKSVYDESKHDIMMPFQFNGKFWVISLYTTKDHIDCSVIAKSKGGGGHKKAAGFQTTDISFLINPFHSELLEPRKE
jgi:oligoribonuclease NrnB/cAMP/cGMP phosphodiesterase (DHH superfamily)